MSGKKYNDLSVLNLYIDNQKKFILHKKQLETIYNRPPKQDNIGFTDFTIMKTNLDNLIKNHQFINNEKTNLIDKHNDFLFQKINKIQKRQNKLLLSQQKQSLLDNNLKKRSNILKYTAHNNLQKDNLKVYNRITNEPPTYSFKKFTDDYNDSLYIKGLRKTFDLPKIDRTARRIVGEDTNMFRNTRDSLDELSSGSISSHLQSNICLTEQNQSKNKTRMTKKAIYLDDSIKGNFGLIKMNYVNNSKNKSKEL